MKVTTTAKVEPEEELKPLQVTIKKDKEIPYDGEDSYQYEDLNPTDQELEEDFED